MENYANDLSLDATEILTETRARSACFHCKTGFERREDELRRQFEKAFRGDHYIFNPPLI